MSLLPKIQLKSKIQLKPLLKSSISKYKLIDLFAGTGAFSYAFEETNQVETVFANDFDENSQNIYNLNCNTKKCQFILKDLNDIDVKDIPSHDILTAGFPCQPFSISGLQKGFNDVRSNSFWKILEIIKHHMPRIVVLENVKNLTSHDQGNTFKIIHQKISDIGYHIKYQILNTSEITQIPQNRERIYIVCFLQKSDHDRFSFDFLPQKNLDIIQFLEPVIANEYYYGSRYKIWDEVEKNVIKDISTNTVYQYRRYYVRENKNGVCPTLTANMGGGGHNVPLIKDSQGIRKLTPRECFNLQGFPKTYNLPNISDSRLYKLAGNAVSVPVVILLANKIMQLF